MPRYNATGNYKRKRRRRPNRFAVAHVDAAQSLSRKLGGTDKDVKEYFYSLDSERLDRLLREYGKQFGASARSYARQCLPKWKSGQTKMSGLVAERLFNLLPPLMPLADKYALVESLWKHVAPKTFEGFTFSASISAEDISAAVDQHLRSVVLGHTIPPALEERFEWLSQGDVVIKQKLLNHLQQVERSLATEALKAQLPLLLSALRATPGVASQTLAVGSHCVRITINGTDAAHRPTGNSQRTSGKCVEPQYGSVSAQAYVSIIPDVRESAFPTGLVFLLGFGFVLTVMVIAAGGGRRDSPAVASMEQRKSSATSAPSAVAASRDAERVESEQKVAIPSFDAKLLSQPPRVGEVAIWLIRFHKLQHENKRNTAVSSLSDGQTEVLLTHLRAMLSHRSSFLRREAAMALSFFRDRKEIKKEALPELQRVLRFEDGDNRKRARDALLRIGTPAAHAVLRAYGQ